MILGVYRTGIHLGRGYYRIGFHSLTDENGSNESGVVQLFGGSLRGRRIGSIQIDLNLIHKWRICCQQEHGLLCQPKMWTSHLQEHIRMVDVNQRCIVKPPPDSCYLALSYVWGTMSHLKLNEETQTRLMQPGGLSNEYSDIPQTIKDAMYLTEQLEEKYLWVDAICIKQDDPDDRAKQIENMGNVYSCAHLTIAAAAGCDANSGLPGVRPNSRLMKQYFGQVNALEKSVYGIPSHRLQLISTSRPYSTSMQRSVWSNRGWVFQEVNLSHRLLVFTEDQVFFHCQSAIWCEDTNLEIPPGGGSAPKDATTAERYFLLASQYCKRQLTDENDSINAIQGILNLLISGHHFGLSQEYFDGAILWSTHRHSPSSRWHSFPSWSLGGVGFIKHERRAWFGICQHQLTWYQARSDMGSSLLETSGDHNHVID
jgi:hypothetical protein